jgi:homoserine kinase
VETRLAREVLQAGFGIGEIVAQQTRLGLFLAGCYQNDLALIRAGLADGLIEPRRARLIPGFDAVKQAALDHHALGASISGAGPSVFGWFSDPDDAKAAAQAMIAAFRENDLEATALISDLNAPGARLIKHPEATCAT